MKGVLRLFLEKIQIHHPASIFDRGQICERSPNKRLIHPFSASWVGSMSPKIVEFKRTEKNEASPGPSGGGT